MRLNKSKLCVLAFMAAALVRLPSISASGSSEEKSKKPEKAVENTSKYTPEKRRSLEIEAVQKLMGEKPVAAMWRAKLLAEAASNEDEAADYSALYTKAKNAVISAFNKATAESRWIDAMRFFVSLESCGVGNAADAGWTLEVLQAKADGAASHGASATGGAPKMAQMVRGTVTVWVDLGLKIQAGTGYVNKVIGSGFFIDSRGYIVTNHHVIENMVDPKYEGYARLYVALADDPDERIPAKVVGWDKTLDLALLKTEVPPPHVFPLGSSEDLEIGDKIYAIGSPIGLERTITSGIVSATDRKLLSTAVVMQIDAAINSGNSGGPIIAENGSVQAVVFAGILEYEGLNFAIPIEYLKTILARLYSGGEIEHCWIGAYGKTMKDAAYLPVGVEVIYVMPGSPAEKAGIVAGDVVTGISGKGVSTIEELQNTLLYEIPDSIITVQLVRAGERQSRAVYANVRPEYPGYEIYKTDTPANYFLPIFGMQLVLTSENLRSKEYYVSKVVPNSTADESNFAVQDKIEVSKVKISDDKDVIYTDVYAKKRRNGYVDIFISLVASLDSPFYF